MNKPNLFIKIEEDNDENDIKSEEVEHENQVNLI
jgi:hypothetical protein